MSQNNKPQVLLIGDSIRMGYCHMVQAELADEADVIFPDGNCRSTHYVIESLGGWMAMCDPRRLAAVHMNCGHWDAARFDDDEEPLTSLSVYAANIGRIIRHLKKHFPNAKTSFATTTPMNPSVEHCANHRTTDEIRVYNRVGIEAALAQGAGIDDLFAFTENWGAEAYLDYCHFTEDSNQKLAKTVADFLRKEL